MAWFTAEALQRRLDRDDHGTVTTSLREVGFPSATSLLATYAGQGEDLHAWLAGAEINRDRNLRLQYLAGMGNNLYLSGDIYDELIAGRKVPPEFLGSPSPPKKP